METLTPERIATILRKHLSPPEVVEIMKVFLDHPGAVAALMQIGQQKFRDEADIVLWAKQVAQKAKSTGAS